MNPVRELKKIALELKQADLWPGHEPYIEDYKQAIPNFRRLLDNLHTLYETAVQEGDKQREEIARNTLEEVSTLRGQFADDFRFPEEEQR